MARKKDTTRAFIAVKITDPALLDRIVQIQARFRDIGFRIKFVRPENMHLTLKFLGNVPNSVIPKIYRELQEAANEVEPLESGFNCLLEGVGQFKNRVLWIGIQDPEAKLERVFNQVERACIKLRFPKERRKFRPHLTIARVKFVPSEKKREWRGRVNELREENLGEFHVDRVELIKSKLTPKGPIYEPLKFAGN